ncbi:MAG: PIN domain-containing protein [Candidatus Poribacteria bacterium]|jgi:uncharacterized protein YacL
MLWIIRALFIIASTVFGAIVAGTSGGIIAFLAVAVSISVEIYIKQSPIDSIFDCLVGLTLGFTAAGLLIYIISKFIKPEDLSSRPFSTFFIVVTLLFGYLGMITSLRKAGRNEFLSIDSPKRPTDITQNYKILDTSVIIDGRIREISQAGFIDGVMLIPKFILNELQRIADSTEALRRDKGRRGFEILRSMQNDPEIEMEMIEEDFHDVSEVDAKLVRLALKLDAKILTNDFNLNKVAELQGIKVLNINQLASSVRPNVVAGEELMVKITREGKEHHQGVGYLDDGTMIVVKNGRQYVDEMVDIIVTQTLQTNAGRMIFARLKGDETESDEPEDLRPYSRGWKRKSYGRSSY